MRILPSLPTGVPRRRTSGESWTRFTKIASSARTCDREERRTYPEDRSRSCPPGSDFQREGCPPSKSQRLHRLDVAWDLSVIRLNPAEIRESESEQRGGALCSRANDLAYNPEHHQRTKHIDRRHFWVRELVENMRISVAYVNTIDNLADFLTKPLPSKTFFAMRDKIMNVPLCSRLGASLRCSSLRSRGGVAVGPAECTSRVYWDT